MFIYLLILIVVSSSIQQFVIGDEMGRTPLCEKCQCVKKTLTEPDVNCNETNAIGFIYDEQYWFHLDNKTNVTYPIESVNLQNNNLKELTKQFVRSDLIKLDLSHNDISKLGDGIFKNLINLEVLILSNNQLVAIGQQVFKGGFKDGEDYPLKIKTLRLDNNQLHTLNSDVFEHIERHLENLYISHNPFKIIDQNTHMAITSVYNLMILDMSHTQIDKLPENFFHTPKHLKIVNLSGNRFEEIPKSLEDVHVLETLNINDNPIKEFKSENAFPLMPTLKTLHMCHMNELEVIEKGTMGGLRNLKEVHITNNNKLRNIDTAAFTYVDVENEVWPPIEKLYLNDNKLTRIERHLLAHWDHLIDLDLRNNPWTCECENQWMLQLMPLYKKINSTQALELSCAAPIEMEGKSFYNLYGNSSHMRCLDLYGNQPEKDADLLVGMLAGLLIGIPAVLFFLYAYQRKFFGLFDNSPAAYSRRFYSRTSDGDF